MYLDLTIDKPGVELSSAKTVLAEGLKHEQYVTSLIHTIYDVAYSVKDFRTMQFLDWFCNMNPDKIMRQV